ncbi:MAG: hypothetical protein EOP04_08465 [Proteobacteria bacterium]|nr:MAG: hypothetical protein EOP04_08465 [Pseudomonadota bacterium]
MHKFFSDWYRVVNASPSAELLSARWNGLSVFIENENLTDALDLLRLVNNLPPSQPDFKEKFSQSIMENDPSFPLRNNEFELALLAEIALIQGIESQEVSMDFSLAICLGLKATEMGGGRRTNNVPDLSVIAENFLLQDIAEARRMVEADVKKTVRDFSQQFAPISLLMKGNSQLQLVEPPLASWVKDLMSLLKTLAELNSFALEESNILWWVIGEGCRSLNVAFESLPPKSLPILVAKDLQELVKVLPGPASAKEILRTVLKKANIEVNNQLSISDSVNALQSEWKESLLPKNGLLARSLQVLDLCPIANAMQTSHEFYKSWTSTAEKKSGIKSNTKISYIDFCYQSYIEMLFMRAILQCSTAMKD